MKHLKAFEKFLPLPDIDNDIPTIITKKKLLEIHDDLIEKYGGIYGIRSDSQLESCLSRPYMSAFGEDIYPDEFSKVSAFLEAIINNHPLADGNKRTGFQCMVWILKQQGFTFKLSYDESRPFLVRISSHYLDVSEISEWIQQNI
mgnify:CR=1 FL=1